MIASIRDSIVRSWWVFLLRGVAALVFGVLAFARPEISLVALVALFGAYALVDGVFMLVASAGLFKTPYFWWVLLDGLLGVAAGALTFFYPGVAALSLLFLLGAWLIIGGICRIAAAVELRKEIENEWVLILGGVLSIAAGLLTFCHPAQSALAWMWVFGIYAVLYGIAMLIVGFKLHQIGTSTVPKGTATT